MNQQTMDGVILRISSFAGVENNGGELGAPFEVGTYAAAGVQ
jgi:hypothetical protein